MVYATRARVFSLQVAADECVFIIIWYFDFRYRRGDRPLTRVGPVDSVNAVDNRVRLHVWCVTHVSEKSRKYLWISNISALCVVYQLYVQDEKWWCRFFLWTVKLNRVRFLFDIIGHRNVHRGSSIFWNFISYVMFLKFIQNKIFTLI